MKKVILISNWDLQCGNAEYARDLKKELEKEFEVTGLPGNMNVVRSSMTSFSETVIVNWHPTRVSINVDDVRWLKKMNKRVIIILQNSFRGPVDVRAGSMLLEADVVVGHEEMEFEGTGVRYQSIPHGIVEVEELPAIYPTPCIGTAGFPFPWKRFDVVAEAAKKFNTRCRMIAPRSDQLDTDLFMEGIAGHIGPLANIYRSWLPAQQVVSMLAECWANIFWFTSYSPEDQLGQSGSVRLGIAARRPVIISTHRKLRTLFQYEDELYIAGREEDVYRHLETILAAPERAKRPKRILEEMGWSVVGKQYRELVNSL